MKINKQQEKILDKLIKKTKFPEWVKRYCNDEWCDLLWHFASWETIKEINKDNSILEVIDVIVFLRKKSHKIWQK